MPKNIQLLSLKLRNFKGVRDFSLESQGDTSVYGDNEAGKTSLFDAFTWLMFDKNSMNQSKFAIKTLDENNKVINGIEHEVEGIMMVDGITV
ncbi:ATP-binding protein, partial [Chengkuizengella axinellae]